MTESKATRAQPAYRTGRMEAFSDGVFAIAITLLILEIGVPAGSGDDLLAALGEQWPSYLAYFVSFATIGAVWFAHTVITEYLADSTGRRNTSTVEVFGDGDRRLEQEDERGA